MSETPSASPAESDAAYRVLARKYRPHSFDDLIGQEPMVRTLTNAFETGRIAQAWMLTGVRGVGKTTTARILARALNYETETIHQPTIHMGEPGIHCRAIMEGRHVDVVEMDAASHTGIDDIREIIAQVRYRPVSARYKVYIIDEVHMLSTQAFNGLLKTLEEPPEHVKFVFATTEIRKVPITVLSRCQRFDLRRVESSVLIAHLRSVAGKEDVSVEDDALRLIARASEGSVRDSLSLTDQAIAHGAGAVTAETVRDMLGLADRVRVIDLFEHVMKGDAGAALAELRSQYTVGADPAVVLADLADFTHLVTTLRYVPEAAEDAVLSPDEAERGLEYSKTLSVRTLGQVWQMLLKALEETRNADAPRQAAEMALIRIAHAADLPSPEDLLALLKREGADALPSPSRTKPDAAGQDARAQASEPIGGGVPTPPGSPAPRPQTSPPQALAAPAVVQPLAPPRAVTAGSAVRAPLSLASNTAPNAQIGRREAPRNDPDEPMVEIANLLQLAELARSKRDSRMDASIRRYIRLKTIGAGRMEIGLADEAPESLVGDLMKRLHDWTGRRWVVSVVGGVETPTLQEDKIAERKRLFDDAQADPAVQAILKAFPGARVSDVRLKEEDLEPETMADVSLELDDSEIAAEALPEAHDGLDYLDERDDIGTDDADFADGDDNER